MKVYNPQLKKIDPRSTSCYFVGYPNRSKVYRFYYSLRNKKFVKSITTKFFKNGDLSWSLKGRDIVIEEES